MLCIGNFGMVRNFGKVGVGVRHFTRFWPKTSSFRLPYQRHNSSADCVKELFKGSNGTASLPSLHLKKNFWLGVAVVL